MFVVKKTLLDSIRSMKSLLIVFPVLFDAMFLIAGGYVYYIFLVKITDHLIPLFEMIAQVSNTVPNPADITQSELAELVLSQQGVMVHYYAVLKLVLLLAVILYVVYLLFQSLSWWYAYKLSGKNIDFKKYLLEFMEVSGFWYVVILIKAFILYKILLFNIGSTIPIVSPGVLTVIAYVVFFFGIYFALISHSVIGKGFRANLRKTWMIGKKKILSYLILIIIIVLSYLIVDFILEIIYKGSYILYILAGFILMMPLISWYRVMYILVSRQP